MSKLVSIIIPTYNRDSSIRDTLDCVLNQSYVNWECIVIDDNSTDFTVKIINEYIAKDDRFYLCVKSSKMSRGASVSRNIGLTLAKGEYIQFLDSDDLIAVNKLEEQIKILNNECELTIITCKWEFFCKKDELIQFKDKPDYRDFDGTKQYFDLIGLCGGFFPIHSILINKRLIICAGFWNEHLLINDDGEFFFRILINATKIIFSEKTFVLYRKNTGNNLSLLNSEFKAKSLVSSWKIIEALYEVRFNEINATYIEKKKTLIYWGLKEKHKNVIKLHTAFFKNQINNDNFFVKIKRLKKKVVNKILKLNASRLQS